MDPPPASPFDSLPNDVVYGHILPCLGPRSLRRARRVCRRFRALCDRYYAACPRFGRLLAEHAVARFAQLVLTAHGDCLVACPGDPDRVGAYARGAFLRLAARRAAGAGAGTAHAPVDLGELDVGAARAPVDLGELDVESLCWGLYPLVAHPPFSDAWAFAPYALHWCATQCRHERVLASFAPAGASALPRPAGSVAAPADAPYAAHDATSDPCPPSGEPLARLARLARQWLATGRPGVERAPDAAEREYWDLLGLGPPSPALLPVDALLKGFPCPAPHILVVQFDLHVPGGP